MTIIKEKTCPQCGAKEVNWQNTRKDYVRCLSCGSPNKETMLDNGICRFCLRTYNDVKKIIAGEKK